jgi:RNA polymerase sigma factor (sigma-70 family)
MEASSNQLVAAAQLGDERAATRLIGEFYERIYAFLRRLSGRMHGIAHHVYVDWRRADRRGEPRTDEWWEACPAPGPGPAELAASADLAHALYAAVDHLEPDLRSTVHLHYYQDLTLQETADALGISASTVKYRLRSALDELQASLVRRPALNEKLQTHRQP